MRLIDDLLDRFKKVEFVWHSAEEEPPKSGAYLCYFRDKSTDLKMYGIFLHNCHSWGNIFSKEKVLIAWAEFPLYKDGVTNHEY